MHHYRAAAFLSVIASLLLSVSVSAEDTDSPERSTSNTRPAGVLFKTYDSDGNAVYSDTRPESAEEGVQVIDPASLDGNVMEQRKDLQEYRRELLEDAEQREKNKQERAEQIEKAKARLEAAKEALKEGKEPRNDDWQRTVEQRRFLKPSYHERVERLEQEVENAKEALEKARRAPVTPE